MKNKMKDLATFLAAVMTVSFAVSPINILAYDNDLPVKDPDHVLNIGSVSKMYTAVAVMQLKEQGKVDLDMPVTEYIPDFTMADDRYKLITVRMLLNHTSGLMGSIYGDSFRYDDKSSSYHDTFLSILSAGRLKADPGEYNCYCNDGFTLLEILVERVSGMSYTEYVEEYICKPLGLNSTGTMWNINTDKQVSYLIKDDIRMAPECVQLLGAGGILSTAEDMSLFGRSFYYGNETILSDESKRQMAEDNSATDLCDDYGLGWDSVTVREYEDAGVKMLVKGGDTNEQHAALIVAPEEKISVSVLSSSGSSSIDLDMAYELMDIALDEKGIEVIRPEEEYKKTSDKVPDKYMAYEGNYTTGEEIAYLSFPEGKYMQIDLLMSDTAGSIQYMYTEEGTFVEMTGDIDSGNAIQSKPLTVTKFMDVEGRACLVSDGGIVLTKVDDNIVSKDVQSAWDSRSGKTYYLYSGGYSDSGYVMMTSKTLNTDPGAPGYVNGLKITDEDHAIDEALIKGNASRDKSDIEIVHEGDIEIMDMNAFGMKFISEDSISFFEPDMKKVELHTGKAQWYKITDLQDTAITLDIPEGTAVYVYDQYGNISYSSFMTGYGNTVPLPNCGMIVFVGSDGAEVGIS